MYKEVHAQYALLEWINEWMNEKFNGDISSFNSLIIAPAPNF